MAWVLVLLVSLCLPSPSLAQTSCETCVSQEKVWCYHDGVCYPRGSSTGQNEFACPGTARCVSPDKRHCECSSCGDAKCRAPDTPDATTCDGALCHREGQYCPPAIARNAHGRCCTADRRWRDGTQGVADRRWRDGKCRADTGPEQFHLALGKLPGTMTLSWTSRKPGGSVRYGNGASGYREASSDTRILQVEGHLDWRFTHVATMVDLKPNTTYSYSVAGRSKSFSFTFQRQRQAGDPYRHIIFGDLGAAFGFSLCKGCRALDTKCDADTCAGNTSVGLVSEAETSDMFLHVGDFAYNFHTLFGEVGDQFMRNIEQVAAVTPYMVSHGNHEDSPADLAHYVERFRGMPVNSDPPTFNTTNAAPQAPNNLYFSWDQNLVHYIALSTELWHGVGDANVNRSSQLAWLEKDLEAAHANRARVPWIVAHGHRDVYCSTGDDGDCDLPAAAHRRDLEPLFHKYGVDIWINGHEHSYERSFPLYKFKSSKSNVDPNATIYVVTGAAGNQEMHEGFTKHQPTWSAFRSNTFGYSRMLVHNASHIHWQQVQTDPTLFPGSDYGRVIDDTWFVQHRHGPFADAPTGTAWPAHDATPSRTLDHFAPLLKRFIGDRVDMEDGSATATHIRRFRKEFGDEAWGKVEDDMLREINARLGTKEARWEDVRDDGSSDGQWFQWKSRHSRS